MKRLVGTLLLAAGCTPVRDPPPTLTFMGLPVSGARADAERAGFDDCFNIDAVHVRCRRHAITVAGSGPYEGAVDLVGAAGEGGFDQLILWHLRDNYAVYAIADALERADWRWCYTGDDHRGDQMIMTRAGMPVRASMDLSYYAKRRFRLLPAANRREPQCTPDPRDARPLPTPAA